MRRQLLTQRGGGLALGALVGLVRRPFSRCARWRLALPVIDQPARVIVQIAVERHHPSFGNQQEFIGGALEQMTIVRHHYHGTGELLQGHGQRQAHFQVEVVGWFIEQQQVGLFPGDQRQGQARLLATGEIHHRLVTTRATEVEATEKIAQGLLALAGRQTLQM